MRVFAFFSGVSEILISCVFATFQAKTHLRGDNGRLNDLAKPPFRAGLYHTSGAETTEKETSPNPKFPGRVTADGFPIPWGQTQNPECPA